MSDTETGPKKFILPIVALAIIAAAASFVVVRAGRAPLVPIRELSLHRERWLGRRLKCDGVVEVMEPRTAREYFVLDHDGFRVGLVGEPPDKLRSLERREVRAEGRLEFMDGFGAYLKADSIATSRP